MAITDKLTPLQKMWLLEFKHMMAEFYPYYFREITKDYMPARVGFIEAFSDSPQNTEEFKTAPFVVADSCKDDKILSEKTWMVFNSPLHRDEIKAEFERQYPDGTFAIPPYFGGADAEDEQFGEFLSKDSSELHADGVKRNECPTMMIYEVPDMCRIEFETLKGFSKHWGNELMLIADYKPLIDAIRYSEDDLFHFKETIADMDDDYACEFLMEQIGVSIINNNKSLSAMHLRLFYNDDCQVCVSYFTSSWANIDRMKPYFSYVSSLGLNK